MQELIYSAYSASNLPYIQCGASRNPCRPFNLDPTSTFNVQPPPPHSEFLMSQSSVTTPVTALPILDAALDSYSKHTGIDLTNHPSNRFRACNTSEDVLQLLQDREMGFGDHLSAKSKLVNCLRPIVQVVHAFSGILGEVAGIVGLGHCPRFYVIISLCASHQVPSQPMRAILASVDVLLAVRLSYTFLIETIVIHCYIRLPLVQMQTMIPSSTSLHALGISSGALIDISKLSHCPLRW